MIRPALFGLASPQSPYTPAPSTIMPFMTTGTSGLPGITITGPVCAQAGSSAKALHNPARSEYNPARIELTVGVSEFPYDSTGDPRRKGLTRGRYHSVTLI